MSKEKNLSKKQLRELMLEQSYSIEALEDEIQYLKDEAAEEHAKLWEIIQENDRLTLTYEPYRPPGDEHENLDFYGLIEENEGLTKKILEKMEIIKEQDEEIVALHNKLWQAERAAVEVKSVEKIAKRRIKNDRWWNFSIELWPGAWGLNYYRYDWKRYGSDSREGQMQIGPFGLSWNREPKRSG